MAHASRRDALVEAGLILASELSLPAVLQKIVDLACDVADARYGALGVVGRRGSIEEFVTHGVTEEERRAIGLIPHGAGILGVLLREPRPLRLRRIQDHPASVGFPPNHPPMTSFLGVPIHVGPRIFGNLYLTEKRGADEFTKEDEDAVVTLAAQAAVAVENARLYQEAENARRRLEAVAEVTQVILEGRETEEVLRLIARRARELVEADVATVMTPEPDGETLVVRVADGHRAADVLGMQCPVGESISGEVMRTRQPLLLTDASADPRVNQPIVRIGDIGPALFAPLAARDRAFGTLTVANQAGGPVFSPENLILLQTFAAQAAVALDHARMREDLMRLSVVEERERIAKELHDDIIQSLFAEGMSLQAAEAMVHEPEAMRTRLAAAVDHIDRVIRDLRNYIFGLRPGEAADRQLDRALRSVVDDFATGSGVRIALDVDPEAASVLAGRASDVVQAAREALSNAIRHSGGDEIALALARDESRAVLEVRDNGKGFEPAQAEGKGHGLTNLRTRAESLGGRLQIESAPGRGTRIVLVIPV